jgi:hypothetical protein
MTLRECLQQCLRLPEVNRVKSLCEPIIHLGQQLASFDTLALLLPQPAQAHGRPQFKKLRVLVTDNPQGLVR